MVICGSYMFESSVSKDMKKKFLKKRIPRYLLTILLKLIIKDLKISVEQDTVVTILNIIKH